MPPPIAVLRRATKGARTRQRLLDVAAEECARLGYERMRVSEVAAKAGVTQPVFYQYFSSKKAIYDELIELFGTRLRSAVELAKIPDDTPPHRVDGRARASVRKLLSVLHDNPSLAKIGFQHSAHAEALKSELVDLLASKVKEEQQAGLLRRDVSPYWLSQAFVGIMERVAMLEQNAADLDDLSAFVSDLLLNGIRAHPSGAPAGAGATELAHCPPPAGHPVRRPGGN